MTFPGLGDTVGTAYVRILADGSGLDDSIRREWDRAEDPIRGRGRRDSKAYRQALKDDLERHPIGKDLDRSIAQGLARGDSLEKFFSTSKWKKFRKDLESRFGDAGKLAGKNLQRELAESGDFSAFRAKLGNIYREIARATKQIEAQRKKQADDNRRLIRQETEDELSAIFRQEQARQDQLRRDGRALATSLRNRERFEANIRRMQAQAERDLIASTRRREALVTRDVNATNRLLHRLDDSRVRSIVQRDLDRLLVGSEARFRRIEDLTSRFDRNLLRTTPGRRGFIRDVSGMERSLLGFERRLREVNIGKLFGAGARNNFVNALGLLIGGAAEGGVRGIVHLITSFARLRSEIKAVNQGGGSLLRLFGFKLGSVLKLAAGSFLGVFGALNILSALLGPIAAAISGLAGGIVALSGSIVSGLAGALGIALPLLVALAATVGVVALAFKGMSKQEKAALKAQFAPLIKEFRSLQAEARKGLFSQIPRQVKLLTPVVKNQLTPLIRVVSRGVADVGTQLAIGLSSRPFKLFVQSMKDFLPNAIERLGNALTHFLKGLGGLTRALVPFAQLFVFDLDKAALRFDRLHNSALGIARTRKFMTQAVTSAAALWRTLGLVKSILADLFREGGTDAGNTLLDRLNKHLKDFDEFLRSPRGKQDLQSWFNSVLTFFSALGKFTAGFAHLFDKLDSPQSRRILNSLLSGFGRFFTTVGNLLPQIEAFQSALGQLLGPILHALTPVIKIFLQAFTLGVKELTIALTPFIKGLDFLVSHLGPLKGVLAGLLSPLAAFTLAFLGLRKVGIIGGETSLFSALGTFGRGLGRNLREITFAISNNLGPLLSAKQKLGVALAGLGIGIGAGAIGNKVGGAGGTAISIAGGAAGGALAGSIFGAPGAAAGAILGAGLGAINSLLHHSADAANAARTRYQNTLALMATYTDNFKAAVSSDADTIVKRFGKVPAELAAQTRRLQRSAAITNLLIVPKGATDSPLSLAKKLHLNVQDVVSSTLGDTRAIRSVQLQLAKLRSSATAELTRFQNEINQGITPSKGETAAAQAASARLKAIVGLEKQLGLNSQALAKAIQGTDLADEAAGKLNLGYRDLATQTAAYTTVLNGSSVAAQRNRQFITDHIAAIVADGKAHKLSATQIDRLAQSFISQAEAAGFDQDKVIGLVRDMKGIPKKLQSKILIDALKASGDLKNVTGWLKEINTGANGGVKVDTTLAQFQLTKTLHLLAEAGQTHKVAMDIRSITDASTRAAVLNQVLRGLPHDIQTKIRAEVLGDPNGVLNNAARNRTTEITARLTVVPHAGQFGSFRVVPAASGMVLNRPTFLPLAGEAGPEAIVPLRRPLSQVDPSVRWLSAIAQGKSVDNGTPQKFASGGVVGGGRSINVEAGAIQLVTPTTDPAAVAAEMLNRLVAQSYF